MPLYEGDCLEIMAELPDQSVDMVLCDLPYGTTKCKWDVILPFDELWEAYSRIVKPNGAVVLFGTEPFSSYLRLSNLKDYRYDWQWNKRRAANFLFMNKQPGKIIELISVFYKKQPTYNPQKILNPKGETKTHLGKNPSKITKHVREVMGDSWKETEMGDAQNYFGKDYEPDKLLPNSLLEFSKPTRSRLHPTQKPVLLLEYLIRTYTNEGETVLDNCAGSGSTGEACIRTEREFILIEKDPQYVQVALNRLEALTPNKEETQ